MLKSQVQIGKAYMVKVSGQVVPVRLVSADSRGGWDGVIVVKYMRAAEAAKRKAELKAATLAAICADFLGGLTAEQECEDGR